MKGDNSCFICDLRTYVVRTCSPVLTQLRTYILTNVLTKRGNENSLNGLGRTNKGRHLPDETQNNSVDEYIK